MTKRPASSKQWGETGLYGVISLAGTNAALVLLIISEKKPDWLLIKTVLNFWLDSSFRFLLGSKSLSRRSTKTQEMHEFQHQHYTLMEWVQLALIQDTDRTPLALVVEFPEIIQSLELTLKCLHESTHLPDLTNTYKTIINLKFMFILFIVDRSVNSGVYSSLH